MSGRILVVDDQAVMLRLMNLPLEKEGYTIITAMSGAEALQKVRDEDPDLIILDLMLPDMSGIEVCQNIRNTLQLANLPIIILSGRTELSAKIEGLEAGADEYVTKPVDPKEMVARVKALLARTQRLRQSAGSSSAPTARAPQGKIVSLLGPKGGVGTTTVTANLATAMAMHGRSTIAMELRSFYGTLARHLGIKPVATLSELLELVPANINERQVTARLVATHHGLRALVGPQHLKEYREIQSEQVEALCATLAQMAEGVFVDLPHIPSIANRTALRAADMVVLVLEPEGSCVEAAKATVDLLHAWSISSNVIKLVVVNRMQSTQTVSASEIERTLGSELLGTVTAAPDIAMGALNRGMPAVMASPDSLMAETLFDISERIMRAQAMYA